jgi:hypothetical protein
MPGALFAPRHRGRARSIGDNDGVAHADFLGDGDVHCLPHLGGFQSQVLFQPDADFRSVCSHPGNATHWEKGDRENRKVGQALSPANPD